jgi:hypothetical protein
MSFSPPRSPQRDTMLSSMARPAIANGPIRNVYAKFGIASCFGRVVGDWEVDFRMARDPGAIRPGATNVSSGLGYKSWRTAQEF